MLPKKYHFLYEVGQLPRTIQAFLAVYGINEVKGSGNNPIILGWAKKLGIRDYIADSIAWCGLLMAWIVVQAGYVMVAAPLWARNWLGFGIKVAIPMLGDVCVFEREGGFGHVGLYVAEDKTTYHIGGGNQSDGSNITRITKTRLLGARMPPFKIAAPASRKRYFVDDDGLISTNEA